ncbi:putative mitochondrial protein [Cucumis melo var. makuwa]|uniref:Mitochondrial protein n=1 Tax=Cucumis melo var. makuwa TaxID=1194695 RepID=A0A5A7SHV9_CUCMM|nr:putative mitochondrial protein [Cucumis melo var. makuwa]
MARKFKSMNTTGTTVKTGRHDSENSTRKAECPTFLRRQKKNYYATLSDEDSDDAEVDHGMNAFTTCITDINLDDDSECSDNDKDEDLTLEKLKMLRKKDSEARAIQKERIQDLMEENERLMGVISSLKVKLKENGSSKYGLGFNASMGSAKFTSKRNVPQIMLLFEMEPKEELLQKEPLIKSILNLNREKGEKLIKIRSDHGKKFDNEDLNNFCQSEGIHHEFAAPKTPQQNGVVEWKNRTLQEMARVMIHAKKLPFWAEAVNTTCHIHNRVTTRSGIVEDDETSIIPDVTSTLLKEILKDDSDQLDGTNINSEKITDKVMADNPVLVPTAHVKKNHPPSSIIGDPSAGITTRKKEKVDYSKMIVDLCYASAIEPTSVEVALKDEYWINAMQGELLQFKRNNVWTLVPKPDGEIL